MQAHLIAPDSAFGPADDRPGSVLSDVRAARARTGNHAAVLPAGGAQTAAEGNQGNVVRSIYDPANDRSRNAAMVFPKQGFVRIKEGAHAVRLGRFEFNEGAETAPGDGTLAWLKRERVAQRLIGVK